MPFHLDEDLSYRVALILREQGMDVTTSWELGWNGLPDEEQLTRAGLAGRCLVSRNYADFARLTKEYQRQGWPHAGVLFVPPSLPNEHLSAIAAALAAYDRLNPDGLPPYGADWLRPVPRG